MAKTAIGFRVQSRLCATCIYRKDSTLDLKALEKAVEDPHMPGYYSKHRTCHHSNDVCCRGFWNKHKDRLTSAAAQIAQRLGMVVFVKVDTLADSTRRVVALRRKIGGTR